MYVCISLKNAIVSLTACAPIVFGYFVALTFCFIVSVRREGGNYSDNLMRMDIDAVLSPPDLPPSIGLDVKEAWTYIRPSNPRRHGHLKRNSLYQLIFQAPSFQLSWNLLSKFFTLDMTMILYCFIMNIENAKGRQNNSDAVVISSYTDNKASACFYHMRTCFMSGSQVPWGWADHQ